MCWISAELWANTLFWMYYWSVLYVLVWFACTGFKVNLIVFQLKLVFQPSLLPKVISCWWAIVAGLSWSGVIHSRPDLCHHVWLQWLLPLSVILVVLNNQLPQQYLLDRTDAWHETTFVVSLMSSMSKKGLRCIVFVTIIFWSTGPFSK